MTTILGSSSFDQCVLSMALIHLCNQASYIGQQFQQLCPSADNPTSTAHWLTPHWFTIYVPHPDQDFEEITLEYGLNHGYNLEVKPIDNANLVPYNLSKASHFVVVLKQSGVNQAYQLVATGLFIRPLATLKLDLIDVIDQVSYQPILVRHPIIRSYPSRWEQKLWQYLNHDLNFDRLPNIVQAVDQRQNADYRSPSWNELRLMTRGFVGVG